MPGCAGRHVSRLGRLTLRGRDPAARHVHHRRTTCSSWLATTAAAARGGCVCGCERCVLLDEQRHVSVSSAGAGGFRGAGRGQRQAQRQEVDGLVVRLARPFGVGRVPEFSDWWAVGGWCCCRRGGCRWWEGQHPDAARPCRCSLARPPSWRWQGTTRGVASLLGSALGGSAQQNASVRRAVTGGWHARQVRR